VAIIKRAYEQPSTDDLELLLSTLPPHIRKPVDEFDDLQ